MLSPLRTRLGAPLLAALVAAPAGAQTPSTTAVDVFDLAKIDAFQGGFQGELAPGDEFGHALVSPGDLDGDGAPDLLVGAPGTDPAAFSRGALWVLFLGADGGVLSERRISAGESGFVGPNDTNGCFGRAAALLEARGADAAARVAVGEPQDCTLFANDEGAVWILGLAVDGTVVGERRISEGRSGFAGDLDDSDAFGHALACVGDLDGNGTSDLAVGAPGDDDGGLNAGAVWILFLDPAGAVLTHVKIAAGQGGFAGTLAPTDEFGSALASLGDRDGNGAPELAVGAQRTDGGGVSRGAVWILELAPSGQVLDQHAIGDGLGGLVGPLGDTDRFGASLAFPGDLDGDGVGDLAVGAEGSEGNGDEVTQPGTGSVWLLTLNPDFTVKDERELTRDQGGFTGDLSPVDRFGSALAAVPNPGGALDDLFVGAWGDPLAGVDTGATWSLRLDTPLPAALAPYGCGLNPAGSLTVLAGLPLPGTSFTLGIDNPLGTQGAGALPLVLPALAGAPGLVPFVQPCGPALPGLGMAGPGAPGELLVDLASLVGTPLVGAPWSGPGSPAPVVLAVPASTALLGLDVYLQGLLYDPAAAFGVTYGLTEAVAATIGS